jgi:two-component system cell cycle response regulator
MRSSLTMPLENIAYEEESILVVDDEAEIRETLVQMLLHLGFKAQAAGDGSEAMDFLGNGDYTFMITDMRMPGMDGLELIRSVQSAFPAVSIIAMTGYSRGYRYIDVINSGAKDFINKPFGIEELEAKVRRAIRERNALRELSRLSITDSLTGLFNQRHFYARLKEEIVRAQRQKHPLALVLMDMDDFKTYNDTRGHLAGDELLQNVGRIINTCIRENVDSGYRYGGDEFAIILIDADPEVTRSIAKRIRAALASQCQITASMGHASFSEGLKPETFVALADASLYEAKGRRKRFSTEDGPLV